MYSSMGFLERGGGGRKEEGRRRGKHPHLGWNVPLHQLLNCCAIIMQPFVSLPLLHPPYTPTLTITTTITTTIIPVPSSPLLPPRSTPPSCHLKCALHKWRQLLKC